MRPEPHAFLGIRVGAYTIADLNAAIADAIDAEASIVIANHNMHSLSLVHGDPVMQSFYANADVVHVDGMPIITMGRLLGAPLGPEHRVTYVDWVPRLFAEAAERGWRVFYLGGKPGTAERGAAKLRTAHPQLQIAVHHGYFDLRRHSKAGVDVLADIGAFAPHVLMVGLGMPRQEHWVFHHRSRIPANAILMSGAALDYVAGSVPTPPRWAGRWSLEWAFRLAAEPRRLMYRYLIEPWPVALRFAREWVMHSLRPSRSPR